MKLSEQENIINGGTGCSVTLLFVMEALIDSGA